MSNRLPERIPACAVNMLARREWFVDPGTISRTRLDETTLIARLLSSRLFVRGQEIGAITLGHTIHFRRPDSYNPHTADGLAFLAHELKHVEQYEREGLVKFYAKYVWAYVRRRGYGKSIPFEAEAYEFQDKVSAHLIKEFANNPGRYPCQEMAEPHTPNDSFTKMVPEVFRYPS